MGLRRIVAPATASNAAVSAWPLANTIGKPGWRRRGSAIHPWHREVYNREIDGHALFEQMEGGRPVCRVIYTVAISLREQIHLQIKVSAFVRCGGHAVLADQYEG
jgi:hypothetical protein